MDIAETCVLGLLASIKNKYKKEDPIDNPLG
jgi:hypothetical protein